MSIRTTVRPLNISLADPDLHVTALAGPGGIGVVVRGELDLAAVSTLHTAVSAAWRSRPAGSGVFHLDLTRVTFLDCAGLYAMDEVRSQVGEHGWVLDVIPPTGGGPLRLLQLAARLGWITR